MEEVRTLRADLMKTKGCHSLLSCLNGLCQWGNDLLRQPSKVPQTHTHNTQERGKGRVPVIFPTLSNKLLCALTYIFLANFTSTLPQRILSEPRLR